MKKTLIVGNWKMNLKPQQASVLLARLQKAIEGHRDIEVVLAPSLLTLQPLSLQIDRRRFRLAAQNAYHKDEGAYTGEVSFAMLVHYVIIGHSERRIYFDEDLKTVQNKVTACVRNGLTPLLCIGESAQERRAGETKQVLHDQVVTALSGLTAEEVGEMVIAYEPVWAISTFGGELAKPGQVKTAMDFIRRQVSELYGKKAGEDIRILYGGSVDEQVVGGYLEVEGCDGTLVGGASLNAHKFAGIVESAYKLKMKKSSDGKKED